MTFDSLPKELLVYILDFYSPKSKRIYSSVSKYFLGAILATKVEINEFITNCSVELLIEYEAELKEKFILMNISCTNGNLPVVKYLHRKNYHFDRSNSISAFQNGHLEVF